MHQTLTIETPDGACEARLFTPLGEGPWPGIVFYMDGLAIRQTLFDILAKHGFRVDVFQSDVINFNATGSLCSFGLARLFPTLGKSLIVRAVKPAR